MSSLAYLIPSLIHFFTLNSRIRGTSIEWYSKRRLILSMFSWILLGFGSFVFHATQTAWAEFIDELGMISASSSMCYALRDLHPLTSGRAGHTFYICFFGCIAMSMLAYLWNGNHSFFAASFICSAVIPSTIMKTIPAISLKTNTLVNNGIIYALVAYSIWHIDQVCVSRNWLSAYEAYEWELQYWSHPVWHVITAVSAHCYIDAIISCHEQPSMKKTSLGVPVGCNTHRS